LELFSIVGFPLLHHIPSLADGTMEAKLRTSKLGAMPAPLSVPIIVPYGYEDVVFNIYVEI
jgi:hypothetical protein